MMSPDFSGQALYFALSIAFGAGGMYYLVRQSRKDVNGLGRKVNQEINRAAMRHQNLTVALMVLAPESKRERIAELLKESEEIIP